MDENNNTSPPQFTPPKVMDFQVPVKTNPPVTNIPVASSSPEVNNEPPKIDITPSVAQVQTTPDIDTIVAENNPETINSEVLSAEPESNNINTEIPTESTPNNDTPNATNTENVPPKQPHHGPKAPVIAILIATVVVLALSGLVVFAFMQSKKNSLDGSADSKSKTSTQSSDSPTDIDSTNESIDNELGSLDDETDFSTNELSDTSLEL